MKLPSWLANKGLSRLPLAERIVDRFYKKDEIETIYGHKMKLDSQDSMNLSRWGFYEKEESDRSRELVKPGQVVLDIGANIGYFSLVLASVVGPTGWVYAYEPHPENYDLLILNAVKNNLEDRIIAKNMACSSLSGWMYLYLSPISSGMHTLEDEMLQRPTYKTSSCLEVRTCRLDDEPLVDPIHFMKIDVEGHELEVLKGAIGILKTYRPILMVEYHASPKVIPFLENLGYEIDCLNEKNLFALPTMAANNIPRDLSSLAEG